MKLEVERGGRPLAMLGTGDFFGEVSVLDGGPRTADVVAATDVRCLVVGGDTVRETLIAQPEAAWEMLRVIAHRLREP